ncbi:Na+/H+ antiporter family protein [Bacteriovorax sp. Seq25_V]|nr:Na+/H+ antiporter NhaC family protein [Bacteriovorax sp. Seq25_V]EQC47136.1 Na+/H+ antiporter family protein [Bacteriovorax sp. Seq25_V]
MKNVVAKLSILPLLVFIAIYLGTGLYYQAQGIEYAFYQLPSPIAIIPAIVVAFIVTRRSVSSSVDIFTKGVSDNNIITMCLIYLLAGAFSSVASASGGVDAVVSAGLSIIPSSFILPGLFIISSIVSTAMGTSMGTIGAIAPIALAVATKAGFDLPLTAGVVLSGAMFGDNLSFISDTTIAATKTQGCEMKDKFKENFKVSMIAGMIVFILLIFLSPTPQQIEIKEYNILLVIPYFAILVLALMGLNVFVVLFFGIILAGVIGMTQGYGGAAFLQDAYKGFTSMQEIFILSMLIGGLSEFIRVDGGLDYITSKIQSFTNFVAKWNRGLADQLGIILLAIISNICIANNTVAIIVVGPIAKQLAKDGDIEPKRSASLLDIFACVIQGLLPYGAQALLLGATFKISPLSVAFSSYYCVILAIVAVTMIIFSKRNKV